MTMANPGAASIAAVQRSQEDVALGQTMKTVSEHSDEFARDED